MRSILTLGIALSLVGCSKAPNRPADTANPAGGRATPDADKAKGLATASADHKFTAQAWFDECKKDKEAARAKYAGKVIEVEGEVATVVDQANPPMALVHLKVEKDLLGVRADCTPADVWKVAVPKSKVVVRGYYGEGTFLTGELYPCIVVSSDAKVETFKAADLAAEVEKDPKEAAEKYKDRWCWVEGKVAKTGKDKLGVLTLTIEGTGKTNISCGVPAAAKGKLDTLGPGQAVRAFGELTVFQFDASISLSQARLE